MNVTTFVCQVCNKNKSNYTCPRCNAMYCTLQCYKKHDKQCTSQFYNDHIMDCLKHERSTKEEAKQMQKKLLKFYEASVKEDEEKDKIIFAEKINNELLSENLNKLQRLAINGKIDINDLTQYQQKEFAKAIKNGHLNHHIAVWNPWWHETKIMDAKKKSIIISEKEIDETSNNKEQQQQSKNNISLIIPSLPIDIPSFDSIHAKAPSLSLPYLLCDILCGYVGAMIGYNGDWNEEPTQVFELILSISCVLSDSGCVHTSFKQMIDSLMAYYASHSVKQDKFEILLYLKQVCVLMSSKMNVLRALNQMFELIQVIQSDIISKSKVSKSLNRKMKNKKSMNVEEKRNDINARTYSSSFAPEKMRKSVRKKCKKLDPFKRKIWYYLVWWNQFVSDEKAQLLAEELKIMVESVDAKMTKIDQQIKLEMKNL